MKAADIPVSYKYLVYPRARFVGGEVVREKPYFTNKLPKYETYINVAGRYVQICKGVKNLLEQGFISEISTNKIVLTNGRNTTTIGTENYPIIVINQLRMLCEKWRQG